ncbi:MAG: hypothetical protein NW226_25500 [Microscillaceae bacterium]|nr:hypothetical protein [Microscillaceae bacterium]
MHILISTPVKKSYQAVYQGFNKDLFLQLNPPFPRVKLLQFDGSKKGDHVKIELNFIFFKQIWISEITDDQSDSEQIYFIDQGIQLPFFLKSWRHKHLLVKKGDQTLIVDDIRYQTPFLLTDYLMFPLMYLQFLYRKPIYRRYFA